MSVISLRLDARCNTPILVAVLSKAYVCSRSIAGITGSNPVEDMDVRLLWRLWPLWRTGHSFREILPAVCVCVCVFVGVCVWGGYVCVRGGMCMCLIVCCIETATMKITWPNFGSCDTKNGQMFAVYGDK